MINIIKRYMKNNRHYKADRIFDVKGFVIHSVGTPQPDPKVFLKLWNTTANKYLAQLLIGADTVYETLPCMEQKGKAMFCWHVGMANGRYIGAEMTEPSTIKYTGGSSWVDLNPKKTRAHVMATYQNAVETFAKGCLFHGLDPLEDGVILSHSECYQRGIGTNHGDVEHLWDYFGLSMPQFRRDIKAAMDAMTVESKDTIEKGDIVKIAPDATYYNGKSMPDWVKEQNWIVKSVKGDRVVIDKNAKKTHAINSPVNAKFLTVVESFKPFMVQVDISNLNMRTGPAKSYDRIGFIPKGIYTIVEVRGDWGRLKSNQEHNGKLVKAWIHLGYTKKV